MIMNLVFEMMDWFFGEKIWARFQGPPMCKLDESRKHCHWCQRWASIPKRAVHLETRLDWKKSRFEIQHTDVQGWSSNQCLPENELLDPEHISCHPRNTRLPTAPLRWLCLWYEDYTVDIGPQLRFDTAMLPCAHRRLWATDVESHAPCRQLLKLQWPNQTSPDHVRTCKLSFFEWLL